MKRRKIIILIILTIISGLLSALGGILGNVATSTPLPPLFAPYLRFAWPAFAAVTILCISLTVWQTLQDTGRSVSTQFLLYRQRMLERVRIMWINEALEQSLHGATLIALGLREQHDAVADPWRPAFQEPDQPKRDLLLGTHITDVYDSTGGELLILGEPGSGKTTLLLELTRDLLKRANDDEKYPIPVVFNLSSWAVKQSPLTEWLIEELYITYRVRPRLIGQSWVENDQVLPLLDGLDEVAEEARAACVDAINTYRREHSLIPTVVCSRSNDYHNLIEKDKKHRLQLHSAVVVQPLTEQQIDDYLQSSGGQLAAMRVALQELAMTPLMLNILMLIYREGSVAKLGSTRQILATYVERMVNSKGNVRRYPLKQTNKWLQWLAQQMREHNQTIFSLEKLRPDWLPGGRGDAYLNSLVGALGGWLVGALGGVLGAGLVGLAGLVSALVFGLVGMLGGALVGGALKSTGVLTWSWKVRREDLSRGMVSGMGSPLVLGLVGAVIGALVGVVVFGLIGALVGAVIGALVGVLVLGLFFIFILDGLDFGPVTALTIGLVSGQVGVLIRVLVGGLVFKLHDGLVGALVGFLVSVLGYGRIGTLVSALIGGLIGGLTGGLVGAVIGAVIGMLITQLTYMLEGYVLTSILVSPLVGAVIGAVISVLNFGLRGGLVGALVSGLVGALGGALVCLLVVLLSGQLEWSLDYGYTRRVNEWDGLFGVPIGALVGGLTGGLHGGPGSGLVGALVGVLGFVFGGILAIALKLYILRFYLWRTHTFPWKAVSFLENATARILLRRVGSGYSFIHRLLLDYFADLEKDDA
jgi:GTPase SAR1 family protein